MRQLALIEDPLPPGFTYVPDFMTMDEEKTLLDQIGTSNFLRYQHGEYTAHRRIAAFGMDDKMEQGHTGQIPDFIFPLRERIENYFQIEAKSLTAVLFTHYPLHSAIGWHRDQPQYENVFGISLLSDCEMDFRLQRGEIDIDHARVFLEARSAYAMLGPSRRPWQHRIKSVPAERYSITFRSLSRGK